MGRTLYRLGAFCARRRRTVLVVWLLFIAAVVGCGVMFAGTFQSSSSIPGSPAVTALTKMDQHFPSPDDKSAQVVFAAAPGHKITDPALLGPVQASLAAARAVPGVASVSDPAQEGMVSKDGRTAVVSVDFRTPSAGDVPAGTLTAVQNTGNALSQVGVKAVYGGDAYGASASPIGPTELVGLGVALLILIVTFGSMLAAGLPLLTALAGVIATMTGLMALSSLVGISSNATTLASMLGLAVGIDYALFIVSRHRRQLAKGTSVPESIAQSTATAGSAVVFAGATVIIALAGLMVAGVPMLTSMGLATAGAVLLAVLMALTLLPALLGVVGRRAIPKPNSRTARREHPDAKPALGSKWVAAVVRHPVRSLAGGILLIAVMAVPALQLTLALPDAGADPATASTRQAYDMVSTAFGPGVNGPLVVLVENSNAAAVSATAATVTHDLASVSGIARISGVDVAPDRAAARIQITPTTGPSDPQTSALVGRVRTLTDQVGRSTGSYVAVTGSTAVGIDVSTKLSAALVPFALVVISLSLLLLMVAFRSVAIPVKATIGFLLSLAASFGATVAVFQWGWLGRLIGVPSQGPVSTFAPIIVMAVLFGLAMDYEVFLVSGMREHYGQTRDPHAAILGGARSASRVVVAAALIMIAVFVGFLFSHDPTVMAIAFGLAVGVFVDAFIVRMTLVPAVMSLLGHRAWTLPRWLDRIVPNIDVEGGSAHSAVEPAENVDDDTSGAKIPAVAGGVAR